MAELPQLTAVVSAARCAIYHRTAVWPSTPEKPMVNHRSARRHLLIALANRDLVNRYDNQRQATSSRSEDLSSRICDGDHRDRSKDLVAHQRPVRVGIDCGGLDAQVRCVTVAHDDPAVGCSVGFAAAKSPLSRSIDAETTTHALQHQAELGAGW